MIFGSRMVKDMEKVKDFLTKGNESFLHNIKEGLNFATRYLRLFILIGVFVHFFSLGIVPTDSMYPTIHPKDMVLFKKTTNYQRGDIIFFAFPLDETQMYLKRVIGLPGDEVEIRNGEVYINGHRLKEPYVLEKANYSLPKKVVPQGHYFVLGDDRKHSFDSSAFGFVKTEKCKGKVVAILLPFHRFHLFR